MLAGLQFPSRFFSIKKLKNRFSYFPLTFPNNFDQISSNCLKFFFKSSSSVPQNSSNSWKALKIFTARLEDTLKCPSNSRNLQAILSVVINSTHERTQPIWQGRSGCSATKATASFVFFSHLRAHQRISPSKRQEQNKSLNQK